MLDGLAEEFPVVLLLDDLHWADPGSLHLLRFLLPACPRPVLVVCGWRDHEVATSSDRGLLAAEIAAAGESWPLAGLGVDDVAALIAATGGQRVGPEDAAAVALRTAGNPLFVSEMARLAAARGAAVSEMVPDTAQGTIRRRVARLPKPAQLVLTVAAVLGHEAALESVRAHMERLLATSSVLHCLPVGRAQPGSAATGALLRPATMREYAARAGYAEVDDAPIEHEQFRFFVLTP